MFFKLHHGMLLNTKSSDMFYSKIISLFNLFFIAVMYRRHVTYYFTPASNLFPLHNYSTVQNEIGIYSTFNLFRRLLLYYVLNF